MCDVPQGQLKMKFSHMHVDLNSTMTMVDFEG